MTNGLVPVTNTNGHEVSAEVQEKALIQGDLSKLSSAGRVEYYLSVCKSLGLNPLTKPFEYIDLRGLKLYATRNCTDQLASNRRINLSILSEQYSPDNKLYTVKVRAQTPDGRYTDSNGVVSIEGKRGDDYANAIMKAETKAKRRAVLSLCGLSWIDESELETVRNANPVQVNHDTGEIIDAPAPALAQPPVYVKMATEKQVQTIYRLGKQLGYTDEKVDKACVNRFGYPPAELAVNQAGEIITELMAKVDEKRAVQQQPDPAPAPASEQPEAEPIEQDMPF